MSGDFSSFLEWPSFCLYWPCSDIADAVFTMVTGNYWGGECVFVCDGNRRVLIDIICIMCSSQKKGL